MPIRVVFMGTPDFAAGTLAALLAAPDVSVELALCQPDKPRGRSREPLPPPVKELALVHDVPVLQPRGLRKGRARRALAELAPDVIVVAAYGRILPPEVLAIPRHGCLNVHASLLPALRGASPIQWAIVEGHAQSGVSIMLMDEGLDTGPVLSHHATPIAPTETADDLHDRLQALGAELLLETLRRHVAGQTTPEPQDDARSSYAPLLTRDSGRLDWGRPAPRLVDHVRGLHPWPGAFTLFRGKRLKLFPPTEARPGAEGDRPGEVVAASSSDLEIACGEGRLVVREVQLAGKRRVAVKDFIHGRQVAVGERLGG
jgi:methionyl-tRNA formyltransferase